MPRIIQQGARVMKKTGFLILNQNGTPYEHRDGIIWLEQDREIAECRADKIFGEYVVPCTITYSIPTKSKKKGVKK